nr:transposase [Eubacterium callanderi]
MIAIGVNAKGHWEIIGAAEGLKENRESWRSFLVGLKELGLKGVRLMVEDICLEIESISEVF